MIAIDWGSSAFRAFLLNGAGQVLARTNTTDGALSIGDKSYMSVIEAACGQWLDEAPNVPIIMGGAVGSRNGWREAPYISCAASIEALARYSVRVENGAGRDIQIVPGVSGPNFVGGMDVMRGEEIQIFGALQAQGLNDALVCLPGTHSKWCIVQDSEITSLTTFMTGEMFALIRHRSSVGLVIDDTDFDSVSFLEGVAAALSAGGLLQNLFSVRADVLLGNLTCASAESYLSGMLIGSEIDAVVGALGVNLDVLLVGNADLTQRYGAVLAQHGINSVPVSSDAAFIGGVTMLKEAQARLA